MPAFEYTRIKTTVTAPKPQVRCRVPNDEEIAKGAPFDAVAKKYLAAGEAFVEPVETELGKYPAVFDGVVQVHLESAEAGRCVNCRQNSRVRYLLKVTGEHGTRKWCAPCLAECYAVDPAAK